MTILTSYERLAHWHTVLYWFPFSFLKTAWLSHCISHKNKSNQLLILGFESDEVTTIHLSIIILEKHMIYYLFKILWLIVFHFKKRRVSSLWCETMPTGLVLTKKEGSDFSRRRQMMPVRVVMIMENTFQLWTGSKLSDPSELFTLSCFSDSRAFRNNCETHAAENLEEQDGRRGGGGRRSGGSKGPNCCLILRRKLTTA